MPNNQDLLGEAASKVMQDLFLTSQLDDLHLSLDRLAETHREGEFSLFLEEPKKTEAQKIKFLEHVLTEVDSVPLRHVLEEQIDAQHFSFFLGTTFGDFLHELQTCANHMAIVKLTVAIEFTEPDVRMMVSTLSEQLGKPTALELVVDRSLVGGALIQYGSYIMDSSIHARLATFRSTWKQATTAIVEATA